MGSVKEACTYIAVIAVGLLIEKAQVIEVISGKFLPKCVRVP